MKLFITSLILLFTIFISAQSTQIEYEGDYSTNFPNPGRGFYHDIVTANLQTLVSFREEGISIVLKTYKLDDYKEGRIALSFLENMQDEFAILRQAGVKMILRFSYTQKTTVPYGDAPLDIVLQHIEQLKPIIEDNSDVILALQAGFIGAWGEWYYTDYFSQSPGNITEENWMDRRTLVDSLLTLMPDNRMVQVRTPEYKKELLQQEEYTPTNEMLAYSNANLARIAHHNDCFVSSYTDVGTYSDTLLEKPFLHQDTKYTIMGGETCAQCSYSHCENAVHEMKRFHWTYLNRDYHTGVINDWIEEGCYDDIELNLGYRFRIIDATMQDESRPGGNLQLNLNLINDGWANPTNKQAFKIVLRNITDSSEYATEAIEDMRFFPLKDTIHINIEVGLPENMPLGNYEILLKITDDEALLYGRKEYSIRLANYDLWEQETGYNTLLHQLTVNESSGTEFFGCKFFTSENSNTNNLAIVIDGQDEDWQDIPLLCKKDNNYVNSFKVTNDADSLYLLLKGADLLYPLEYFLDMDNDIETGFSNSDIPAVGADFRIANGQLYQYMVDSGSPFWQNIADLNNATQNDQTMEIAVALNDLGAISQGKFNIGLISGDEYNLSVMFPAPCEMIPLQLNTIYTAPQKIKTNNKGKANLIYWTKNPKTKESLTHLQKATLPSDDFQTIYTGNNQKVAYLDVNTEENQEYSYRVFYEDKGKRSAYSIWQNQITSSENENYFLDIQVDGGFDDWVVCPPSITGMYDNMMSSLRFFNTQEKLFFAIESIGTENHILLNTDAMQGFDYLISNDSLYYADGDNWIYQNSINVSSDGNWIEGEILLSEIAMDVKDFFYVQLVMDGEDLWDIPEGARYMKYAGLSDINNFGLLPSVSNPYTRIKIKWEMNTFPDSYVIERSENDSLNFEQIAEVNSNNNYYLDNDLDSSNIYYYRMFTAKGLVRSAYTPMKWMKPGAIGVEEHAQNITKLSISPNPIRENAVLDLKLKKSDEISISITDMNGKTNKELFVGKVNKRLRLPLYRGNLKSGVYLLKISGQRSFMQKKIIVY